MILCTKGLFIAKVEKKKMQGKDTLIIEVIESYFQGSIVSGAWAYNEEMIVAAVRNKKEI